MFINHQLLLSQKEEDIQNIQTAYPHALYTLEGYQYKANNKDYWAWELSTLPVCDQTNALRAGHAIKPFMNGSDLRLLVDKLLDMQQCEELFISAVLTPGSDKRDILTYDMEEPMDPDETGYVWDVPEGNFRKELKMEQKTTESMENEIYEQVRNRKLKEDLQMVLNYRIKLFDVKRILFMTDIDLRKPLSENLLDQILEIYLKRCSGETAANDTWEEATEYVFEEIAEQKFRELTDCLFSRTLFLDYQGKVLSEKPFKNMDGKTTKQAREEFIKAMLESGSAKL